MSAPMLALPLGTWSPFHFDPGALFWTWVVFAAVVFILAKAAWKPLLASLEQREQKMKEGVERAERAEAEAKRAAAETETKLREAYAKADRIVEETRARGEKLAKELEADAHAQAEKLLTRAREEIDLAKSQAVEELRVQAVDLALEVAGSVLNRSLTGEDQRRLAREAVDLIGRDAGGKARA
jgi:F-type H+-transporting ATPase subunit b